MISKQKMEKSVHHWATRITEPMKNQLNFIVEPFGIFQFTIMSTLSNLLLVHCSDRPCIEKYKYGAIQFQWSISTQWEMTKGLEMLMADICRATFTTIVNHYVKNYLTSLKNMINQKSLQRGQLNRGQLQTAKYKLDNMTLYRKSKSVKRFINQKK